MIVDPLNHHHRCRSWSEGNIVSWQLGQFTTHNVAKGCNFHPSIFLVMLRTPIGKILLCGFVFGTFTFIQKADWRHLIPCLLQVIHEIFVQSIHNSDTRQTKLEQRKIYITSTNITLSNALHIPNQNKEGKRENPRMPNVCLLVHQS